jgi:transposase
MNKGTEHIDSTLAAILESPYWHQADASLVLAAWSKSGLSLSAFARRHGIKPKRLWRWHERLPGSTTPAFHRVRVVFDGKPEGKPDGEGAIELVLRDGRRVAVRPGFDASVLEELVRVVESWPC